MRPVLASVIALLVGCAAGSPPIRPSTTAYGATLSLVHYASRKPTFELANSGTASLAYNHWFALGPEPVAYCRDEKGAIRFCSLRFMLADDDQPYIHESYLQPGRSVKFQAAAFENEQLEVHLWVEGREEVIWLGGWTPNKRSSGRVNDKVPSSYVGVSAAQLNR
jgi:hypothetical protein